MRRKVIVRRDLIMRRLGTAEKLVQENTERAMQWRKPLSLAEVNQMAPTPEVLARPGRA